MSLRTQAKVLRVLEEQRLEPVGSNQPSDVNVRVIAATNKKLEDQIAHGLFREDLFYRLNVIPFTVPALRERIEDIPILAQQFLTEYRRRLRPQSQGTQRCRAGVLTRYTWPGNVRELRNLIERLVIICPQERIEPLHLPPELFRGVAGSSSKSTPRFTRPAAPTSANLFCASSVENQWNMTRTAQSLGLERSHLYRKMKSLGISAQE